MTMTFLYPLAGWLFVLLPLVWWSARTPRRPVHLALRMAIFCCVILAMMQPSIVYRSGQAAQVFVVDQRPQTGAAARAQARAVLMRMLANAPRGAKRTLIQLGGAPIAAAVDAHGMVTGASLSVALARAVEALPLGASGAITIIANPRSTDAHWEDSVDALVARGIPVNTIALPATEVAAFIGDVRIAQARVGETVAVMVEVQGDGRDHVVTLSSGSRRLASAALAATNGSTQVALRFPAERAGFLPIRATLDGGGSIDTVAAIQDPLKLLYLGTRQVGAAPLLQRLLGRGFAVEQQPAATLARATDPARYPLILLDDVPAAAWPVAAQRRVMAAVADRATGLIAAGGKAAFGMGGYAATPMAAALPVTARQEDRLERPSVALAIVIDSSGSMQGEPLDLAKQIARQTVRKLTPADWVGVVEFYGAKQWAVPIQPARDTAEVERAIGRMESQGSSMLFPALQEAYYGLKDVEARYKHILVISDGGVVEDRYQQLLRHIADDRINVSTAVVGTDASGEESMAEWARIGRGRFYSVADEFGLVAIDFHQPQTKPQPGYRGGDFPVVATPGLSWWQDGAVRAIPPLAGYARVRARDAAEIMLSTATGDPVLASWQYGSGRVTALATEPLGEGTRAWQSWAGYGPMLARIAAMTARQRPAMDVTITRRFDRLGIVAQRLDGTTGPSPSPSPSPSVVLLDEQGRTVARIPSEERAPGLFAADFAWPATQVARVEVRDGDRIVRAADRASSDVSPADAMPENRALPLARLAAATGGWTRDDPAAPPGPAPRGGKPAAADLWPWLALLALGLYLAEIVYRRLPARRAYPRYAVMK